MAKRTVPTFEKLKDRYLYYYAQDKGDRDCAVLYGAYVDASLEAFFRNRLKSNEALYAFSGPLATFSSKIALAHGLGWIDDSLHADLNVFREVRNEFAHSFDHSLNFNSQSIKDRCRNLKGPSLLNQRIAVAASASEEIAIMFDDWKAFTSRDAYEHFAVIAIELFTSNPMPPYMQWVSWLCEQIELPASRIKPYNSHPSFEWGDGI